MKHLLFAIALFAALQMSAQSTRLNNDVKGIIYNNVLKLGITGETLMF